jgi:sarcosine oxidase
MPNNFDAIVIGVGAMGASTCFHLAGHGVKTLGLEQFDIPHTRGSSHGDSRMIRKAYFEHPNYVPLLHRAYALWDELEAISRRRLLHRVGGIFIGPKDKTLVGGALAAAKMHHLPHELMDAGELRRRWPQFVVPDDWHAFYEPDSGFLLPERAIGAYAEHALRRGAEIHAREPVRQWKREGSHYIVQTDVATYAAGRLIFCGGAWSGKLLADLGVSLKVTRQILAWVWPKEPRAFELGHIPVWGIDSLDGGLYYGFPMHAESVGFKFAHHLPSDSAVDPDTVSRDVRPSERDTLREILRKFLPAADGPWLALKTCLYTNSPDGHFIIDHHPDHPRVEIACGFSGHGFKFASVIGAVLAEAAVEGKRDASLDFLGLGRFAAVIDDDRNSRR